MYLYNEIQIKSEDEVYYWRMNEKLLCGFSPQSMEE